MSGPGVRLRVTVARRKSPSVAKSIVLEYQHGIAKAVEAVALADGLVVGPQDEVAAREGGDQHEQGGAGEMEVGYHRVYEPEVCARYDVEVGPTFGRLDLGGAVSGLNALLPRYRL